MSSSRRNERRKSTSQSPSAPAEPAATPVMNQPRRDVPAEFIDLSTESFHNEFPNLAKRQPGTGQSSRPRRSTQAKPDSGGEDSDT